MQGSQPPPSYRFHPTFQWRLNMILGELRSLGWQPVVHHEAVRTIEQEAQKVKEGKSHTLNSWHVRSTIGLLRHSKRTVDVVHGNAADIIDKRWGWDGPAANQHFKFWLDLGRVAKKYGCRWGGDWTHRDMAHIEFLFIDEPPQPRRTSDYA
jgi:hypothetical protein